MLTTCQFQEVPISLSREKKKDQLSQLVPGLTPAESSHGVIETASRSTFSSFRRKQEGSNANDRVTVMPTTVKGEHVSSSDVLLEWSWKSQFCYFRRNSRNNTEAEVRQQPRKSRLTVWAFCILSSLKQFLNTQFGCRVVVSIVEHSCIL